MKRIVTILFFAQSMALHAQILKGTRLIGRNLNLQWHENKHPDNTSPNYYRYINAGISPTLAYFYKNNCAITGGVDLNWSTSRQVYGSNPYTNMDNSFLYGLNLGLSNYFLKFEKFKLSYGGNIGYQRGRKERQWDSGSAINYDTSKTNILNIQLNFGAIYFISNRIALNFNTSLLRFSYEVSNNNLNTTKTMNFNAASNFIFVIGFNYVLAPKQAIKANSVHDTR